MSNGKLRVGSGAALFSSWFALIAYGCVAAPAENTDGGDGASGTAGGLTGGTSNGGAGVTGGAPAGGTGQGGLAGTGVTGGAAPTGGVAGAGVTGGVAGAGVTGGAAGAPGGTSSGGAGGGGGSPGGVNTDAMCKSISNDMPCTAAVGDGKACPMMPCGLGDMGRRDCSCATNWSCTQCSFVGTVIETRPANADTACGADVVAGMPCTMNVDSAASVCKSSSTSDPYCMCASDPRNSANGPEWNCDSKPGPWPM